MIPFRPAGTHQHRAFLAVDGGRVAPPSSNLRRFTANLAFNAEIVNIATHCTFDPNRESVYLILGSVCESKPRRIFGKRNNAVSANYGVYNVFLHVVSLLRLWGFAFLFQLLFKNRNIAVLPHIGFVQG